VTGQARSAARINDRDVSYVLSHPEGPFQTVDLPPGSLVVEKYRYTNRRGNDTGVQWLAQSVDKDGNLLLHRACRTRKEALEVVSRV